MSKDTFLGMPYACADCGEGIPSLDLAHVCPDCGEMYCSEECLDWHECEEECD